MIRSRFYIDRFQAEWIFSPIRSRKDVIILLMKSIKLMLVYKEPAKTEQVGEISLVISKMSRIFFSSHNKVFSLNFPFFTNNMDGGIGFYTREFPDIDNRLTSIIIQLVESSKLLDSYEVLDFAEPICEAADIDKNIWALLRQLIIHEDGYLRFDHDPIHAKKGKIHPLNHYDVFYSTATTFKLGATRTPDIDHLIDILNTKSDCYTLS